jgi:hypothetical protein
MRRKLCSCGYLVAVVLAGAGCKDSLTAPAMLGEWGGEHVALTVSLTGATIEYDCAHGSIDGPIVPDLRGVIDLTGMHVFEHGGPVQDGEIEDAHPARYRVWIDGHRMTLTVTLTDTAQSIGKFELRLGEPGMLMKCL